MTRAFWRLLQGRHLGCNSNNKRTNTKQNSKMECRGEKKKGRRRECWVDEVNRIMGRPRECWVHEVKRITERPRECWMDEVKRIT